MPTPRKHSDNAERQRAYRGRQEAARRAALEAKNMPATSAIPTMPSTARWKVLRDQAQAILETMIEEMEAYRDDRSEEWQQSERAGEFQELIERTDEARAAVEGIFIG